MNIIPVIYIKRNGYSTLSVEFETFLAMINYRTIGVNFNTSENPTIKIWAPFADELSLVSENIQPIKLFKMPLGYWQADCPGLKPCDYYKLKIGDESSFPDPASLSQPQGVHQSSECLNLNELRQIKDNQWRGAQLKDLVIYELHVGTFTPEGTFNAIKEKLPYLKELGVNALNIMPVASFSGNRNWGYDGVYPFAVHAAYGGAIGFAELIKECHQNGIAVILDVVYNHLGPEGNYLGAFGPSSTQKYKTPWGNALNFDDSWCDGVREFFLENALMWLRDFHVDGLRLDAVHAIKDFSPKHFLRELSEKVRELNQLNQTSHFLIGECDLNDVRYIKSLDDEGYGLDAQWCDEWHHALHALITKEKNGYYSDFGKTEQLTKSFNHGYVFTGNYSPHRKKKFGTPTTGFSGQKFVIFTQNHDHTGNRMLGERLSQLVDFNTLKLAAGAMMVSPFIPLIFMGEEYGEESPFLYFISHEDKDLVEAVRKGRSEEFRDFIGQKNPPDPASEETFQQSKLKWDFEEKEQKVLLLAFYKKLISLRNEFPVLKPGNLNDISARNYQDAIIIVRKGDEYDIISVLNFSDNPQRIELPELLKSSHNILLYSAHKQWGGNIDYITIPLTRTENSLMLEVEKKSIVLFQIRK
jgi:maltooligosyltrehalose trehalohydrolase